MPRKTTLSLVDKYELHITTDIPTAGSVAALYEELAAERGWSTSQIARDPELGPSTRFYFTTHTTELTEAYTKLEDLVSVLGVYNIPVRRQKIEAIIYDVKTP